MDGTPIDLDKLRSLGVIGRRTRDRVVEGRAHPETGKPFKAVTDELNNTVTEHGDRQDVNIRAPLVRMTARQTEERQP